MVGGRVLVGPERVKAASRRIAGHRRELLPGDEPAPSPDGDQLPDLVAVAGDGERLPVARVNYAEAGITVNGIIPVAAIAMTATIPIFKPYKVRFPAPVRRPAASRRPPSAP